MLLVICDRIFLFLVVHCYNLCLGNKMENHTTRGLNIYYMWLPTIIDHQKMSRHRQPMVEGSILFYSNSRWFLATPIQPLLLSPSFLEL